MVTIALSKSCKGFTFDEIWNSTNIEGPEFNGGKIFCDSWRLSKFTPVDIGTCHLLGQSFGPKTENAPVLIKFCTLHKTSVVNSTVSILRGASGCRRELKRGIEKQILCQKCNCYIINKTGKKLWLTSAKLFS